jgi:hypothetical protein
MSGFKSPALAGITTIKPKAPKRVQPSGILHFTISVSDLERSRYHRLRSTPAGSSSA